MAAAVAALDVDLLAGADDVRAIAECAPTPQEAVLLAAYAHNEPSLATLSDAELFCYQLMKVRRGRTRGLQTGERMPQMAVGRNGEAQNLTRYASFGHAGQCHCIKGEDEVLQNVCFACGTPVRSM